MNANEIVRALRCCSNVDTRKPYCDNCPLFGTRLCVKTMLEGAADLIESLLTQLAERDKEIERLQESQRWIPVNERLPEPEKRVLVCAESRLGDKVYGHIAMAMYEDGTVWTRDSSWGFYDLDNYGTYDEKQDDWKIPEGWWEYSIYNEEGNCPVDDLVTHWMPLPEPPEGGAEK